MITKSWLYDIIIYIYALSLLFYFTDAVSKNNGAKRMGEGLLVFVWVLQTLFFFVRMYEHRYVPVFTRFEALFFFSWALVTVSLAASRFFSMQMVVFFVNVFAFVVLVLNLLTDPGVSPIPFEASEQLLGLHVALAMFSYVAFALSAVLSGMYLFLHNRLKRKRWSQALRRLPSLEVLERHLMNSVMIGIPILILSLSLGIVWFLLDRLFMELLLDVKVYATLAVLLLYVWMLVLKRRYRVSGKRLALWSIGSFTLLLLNFFVTNSFSGFHSWF